MPGEKSLTQLSRETAVRQRPDETGPNMVRSMAARAVARIFSGGRQGQVRPRSGKGDKIPKTPKPPKMPKPVKAPKTKPSNVHRPGQHTQHVQSVKPKPHNLNIGKPTPTQTPLDPNNVFDNAFGYGVASGTNARPSMTSQARAAVGMKDTLPDDYDGPEAYAFNSYERQRGHRQPRHQAQARRPPLREPDYSEPVPKPASVSREEAAQRTRDDIETTEAQMIRVSMNRGIPAPPYGPNGKPLWGKDPHFADRLLAYNEAYGMQTSRKGVAKALVLAMREV